MIGVFAILFFALIFLIIAGVIRLPNFSRGNGAMREKSAPVPKPDPLSEPVIIRCPQCDAKLRVSGSNEMLKVTCPKCQNSFFWYDGTEQKTAHSTNELDAYRNGGALWVDSHATPNTAREATLALIATLSGSMITTFFDRNGDLGALLRETKATINFVDLLHTNTEVVFTIYFHNAPMPNHSYRYPYNEFVERAADEPIVLKDEELLFVRRMALSHLTEIMPNAYMREGRIYEHK